MNARDAIELLLDKAGALREAGVRRLEVPGAFSADLDKPDEPEMLVEEEAQQEYTDPLDDPSTFGGFVPGIRRHDEEAES